MQTWITATDAAAIIGCKPRHVHTLGTRKKIGRVRSNSHERGPRPFVYSEQDCLEYARRFDIPSGFTTIAAAAKTLDIHSSSVRAQCRAGKLHCVKGPSPQGKERWLVQVTGLAAKETAGMTIWKCPHCQEVAQVRQAHAPQFLDDGCELICSECGELTRVWLEAAAVELDLMGSVYVSPTGKGLREASV